MEIPIKENEDGKKAGKRERKRKKIQEKTKKKNREKTRDQEAIFVEIREETESKRLVEVRKKTGGSSLSLPFPSPSSSPPLPLLFPFPFLSFRDLHKVQKARLLENVRTEKNVVGVGNRKNMTKKKLYEKILIKKKIVVNLVEK